MIDPTEMTQGGAKAAIAQASAKSRDLWMVPIDQIRANPAFNVRVHDADYEAHIESIAESIIENGFYQNFPLSGFAAKEGDETHIVLVGGFTRYEAAKRAIKRGATLEGLPVVLKPPGTSMIDLHFALVNDNTGSPLKPYERAVVAKRLIGYGSDVATIARRMNVTEKYVNDLLFLTGLPQPVQQMVATGQFAASYVIGVAREHGGATTAVLQDTIAARGDPLPASAGEADVDPLTAPAVDTDPLAAPERPGRRLHRDPFTKKTYINAINYALVLPSLGGNGLKWLRAWVKRDPEAVNELAAYKPPRQNAKRKKPDPLLDGPPAEEPPL